MQSTPTASLHFAAGLASPFGQRALQRLRPTPSDVTTQPFEAWFHGSTICDARGEPIMAFHGSRAAFDAFAPEKAEMDGRVAPEYGRAHYFTLDPVAAAGYAASAQQFGGEVVYPVYLSLRRPYVIDLTKVAVRSVYAPGHDPAFIKRLQARGYDGIIVVDEDQDGRKPAGLLPDLQAFASEIVVFDAAQIRSAIADANDFTHPAYQNSLGRDTAFRRWLGRSRAVDASGAPLTLYHGTMADFSTFDFSRLGEASDHPTAMLGAFFSTNPDTAAQWAWDTENGGQIMPVHLAVEHPLELDGETFRALASDRSYRDLRPLVEALQARVRAGGHDGIHVRAIPGATGEDAEFAGDIWIATKPEQIKSAIGNRGTYDVGNPDIRFARSAAELLPELLEVGGAANGEDARKDGAFREAGARDAAFAAWFRDSKIVDPRGAPLVVVHATLNDFSAFELRHGEAQSHGFFFAPMNETNHYLWSYLDAVKYQEQEREGNHFFMPVYLSLQNPKTINTTDSGQWADPDDENAAIAAAKREGHDGLILRDDEHDTTFYVAFDATQIKSALGNRGTYDANHADIRFRRTETEERLQAQSEPAAALFDRWFRDSMAVDDAGLPLTLYHGTCASEPITEFCGNAYAGWFTECPARANAYTSASMDDGGEDGAIYPVHLAVHHPLDLAHLDANKTFDAATLAAAMGVPVDEVQECFDNVASGPCYWNLIDTPDFREWVEALGCDGVRIREGGVMTWAAVRAEQIASVYEHVASAAPAPAVLGPQLDAATTNDAAFRDWFRNSAAVDEAGVPLTLYHGTASDFNVFDPSMAGRNFAQDPQGLFFAENPAIEPFMSGEKAAGYTLNGQHIVPVHLCVQRPLVMAPRETHVPYEGMRTIGGTDLYDALDKPAFFARLREGGHDGAYFPYTRNGRREGMWIALAPTQVKSVFNAGSYALDNPDIRFARAGASLATAEDAGAATLPTATFEAWFQQSQVVDDFGQPLTMYHGTSNDFAAFDTKDGTTEGAAFFSTSPANVFADPFTWGQDPEDVEIRPNVKPVFLAIQNPLHVTRADVTEDGHHSFDAMRRIIAFARRAGHDGLHIVGYNEGGIEADQWAAFHPHQIKSVFNTGSFDATNDDIRFAREASATLPHVAQDGIEP
ncbi:hypothetical protein LMG32289_05612 [Cupriavidus pampae]|uniref:ART-PolyVal-like domain-containing protein n=2 Tax=Cupriavidus pampae TaxID=659251 RepID=A0ABN7ZEM2_9BURK|nr:hypothetical protein LMG32289_05612 [Cupriavidus pampae]